MYGNGELSGEPKRIVGPDGQPVPKFVLDHLEMFSAIYSGPSKTYRTRFDEALRHSRSNSLAMRRDAQIMSLLRERQMATVSLPWTIEPEESDDPAQKKSADRIKKGIEGIPDLDNLWMANLEAVWYGRAGAELLWRWDDERAQRQLDVVDHFPVNGDKFVFTHDGVPGILIRSSTNIDDGARIVQTDRGRAVLLDTPHWRERFTINIHEKIDADFYEGDLAGQRFGVGVRNFVYWYWWLQSEIVSWVIDYVEKVGLGITIFYFDQSSADSQRLAMEAAKQQSRNTAIVWPRPTGGDKQGSGVERLEVPVTGAEFLLKIITEYFLDTIRTFIVGQSLSSQAEKSGGLGSSVADLHASTKQKLTSADARRLQQTLTRDLVRVWQKWNMPETVGQKFRLVFAIDKPNAKEALEAAKTAFEMGAELDNAEIISLTGLSVPKKGAKILSKAQQDQQQAQLQQQQQAAAQQQQPGAEGGDATQQLTQLLSAGGGPGADQPGDQPKPAAPEAKQPEPAPAPEPKPAPTPELAQAPAPAPEQPHDWNDEQRKKVMPHPLPDREVEPTPLFHARDEEPVHLDIASDFVDATSLLTFDEAVAEIAAQYARRDVSKESRDANGRWSAHPNAHPVATDLDREQAINHFHPQMHAIGEGELGHVWGWLMRRHGPDEFRVETDRGHLQGPANVVLDHLAGHWRAMKPEAGRVRDALARAEAHHEPDIFEDHDGAASEAAAYESMPHGARVVSLEPHTFGRVGQIMKQHETTPAGKTVRRNRVKLDNSPEWASHHVEPLDEKHSWRRPPEVAPPEPQPRLEQGSLFDPPESAKPPQQQSGGLTLPPQKKAEKPVAATEVDEFFAPKFTSRQDEQGRLFQKGGQQ